MAEFLTSELLGRHGVKAAFSMRRGGISPAPFDSLNLGFGLGDEDANVRTNLRRLMQAAGLCGEPHQAAQAHGTACLACHGPGRIHEKNADILVSADKGCILAVRTADCVPILLADTGAGIVAAVHAGWRGTTQHIASVAVSIMQDLGAEPENILASLGPCIGPCCFETDRATAALLAASCDEPETCSSNDARPHTDLAAINRLQLIRSGLSSSHVEHAGACTCCRKRDFFSHRRNGSRSGRQLAIVAIRQES